MSVANTTEWHEPIAVTEVGDSYNDGVTEEDLKPSIPVRAYFFSTRYDNGVLKTVLVFHLYIVFAQSNCVIGSGLRMCNIHFIPW